MTLFTWGLRAPQRFFPPKPVGRRVQWAWRGCVVLTGRLPFRGADRAETAHLLCTQPEVKFPSQSAAPPMQGVDCENAGKGPEPQNHLGGCVRLRVFGQGELARGTFALAVLVSFQQGVFIPNA